MINKTDSEAIFDSIADKYDLINHLVSFGKDIKWRRRFINTIPKKKFNTIVDIATGTGKLLIELKKLNAESYYGLDISEKMLEIAKKNYLDVNFLKANSENMPLSDNFADLVTISFGFRNFKNTDKAIKEIYRILKPNGILAIMEFGFPKYKLLYKPYLLYFNYILPFIGKKISNDQIAYSYFKNSVSEFNTNYNVEKEMIKNKFIIKKYRRLSNGIINIYIFEKT